MPSPSLDDLLSQLFSSGSDPTAAQLQAQPAPQQNGGGLSALLSLPGSVLRGYQAAYAALPQRMQDDQTSRSLDLANKMASLQYALGQRKQLANMLPQLPQDEQLSLLTNPTELGKSLGSNFAPQTAAPGATIQYGRGGQTYTAPVAPKFSTKDGVVLNENTGDIAGTYSTPQALPAGARPGAFTPQVAGGQALAGSLPQMPPNGMPAPGAIGGLVPGAQVSSGFRTPQKNAAVGGAPNSWHTTGTPDAPGALDVVPPAGMDMQTLAGTLASKLPQMRVINEGDHAHVQPNQRNTGASMGLAADGTPGWQVGPAAPQYTARTWNPQTNRFEQTNVATGEVSGAGDGAIKPQELRNSVSGSDDYKEAQAANTAFKAMLGNAGQMTGPGAYSILDTFARAINPGAVARPQVIQTIEANLGLPAQFWGKIDSTTGKGNLTPETRQQILDAVTKFAGAHWDAANSQIQSARGVAQRAGLNPDDVSPPLDARPGNVFSTLPPKAQLKAGDIFLAPAGPHQWTGTGFKPYGR